MQTTLHTVRDQIRIRDVISIDELLARIKLQFDADRAARSSIETIIEHWITKNPEPELSSLEAIAARLAYDYSTNELNFDFCSGLMRYLYEYSDQSIHTSLFWDVFIAFDAGEFYHNDDEPRDVDPSELHTRPMINDILSSLGKNEVGNG